MARVFLSYARESSEVVALLVESVSHVHEVMLDERLRTGQPWWDEILAMIRNCDVFVAALCPAALTSVACASERAWAAALGKPILPVAIDGKSIHPPRDLRDLHVLRYEHDPDGVGRLLGAIARTPAAPPPPSRLPEPPALPRSAMEALAERVEELTVLDAAAQGDLALHVDRAVKDPQTKRTAKSLWEQMKRSDGLLQETAQLIERLERSRLSSEPPPPETVPVRSGVAPAGHALRSGTEKSDPGNILLLQLDSPEQWLGGGLTQLMRKWYAPGLLVPCGAVLLGLRYLGLASDWLVAGGLALLATLSTSLLLMRRFHLRLLDLRTSLLECSHDVSEAVAEAELRGDGGAARPIYKTIVGATCRAFSRLRRDDSLAVTLRVPKRSPHAQFTEFVTVAGKGPQPTWLPANSRPIPERAAIPGMLARRGGVVILNDIEGARHCGWWQATPDDHPGEVRYALIAEVRNHYAINGDIKLIPMGMLTVTSSRQPFAPGLERVALEACASIAAPALYAVVRQHQRAGSERGSPSGASSRGQGGSG